MDLLKISQLARFRPKGGAKKKLTSPEKVAKVQQVKGGAAPMPRAVVPKS